MFTESAIVELDINSLVSMEINPRTIKDEKYRKLQQSILKDPDFMSLRPVLVNKVKGVFSIYAGTQRWTVCKDLGWLTIPCIVEENIPDKVLKERMLKDNVHAGEWDIAKLSEFDTSVLDSLDLSAMNNKVDWEETTEDTPKEQKANKEKKEEFGGHHYLLLFGSVDEKEAFNLLLKNAKGDTERAEDYIIDKAKKYLYAE